jgi:hypothetical protein
MRLSSQSPSALLNRTRGSHVVDAGSRDRNRGEALALDARRGEAGAVVSRADWTLLFAGCRARLTGCRMAAMRRQLPWWAPSLPPLRDDGPRSKLGRTRKGAGRGRRARRGDSDVARLRPPRSTVRAPHRTYGSAQGDSAAVACGYRALARSGARMPRRAWFVRAYRAAARVTGRWRRRVLSE